MKCWIPTVILLFAFRAGAQPVLYHLDNTHSSIQFTVPFFGVSEVAGRFDQFCGTFLYDQAKADQSRIELFVLTSSINTGIGMRDRDLRENYFESGKFPFIRFTSNKIQPTNPREFAVTGTLDMHGITREIAFTLSTIGEIVTPDGKEWGFKSTPIVLDRTVYGVNKGNLSGDQVSVGNMVTTSSIIRLRENSPDRRKFELAHPAINQAGLEKFEGTFINQKNAAEMYFVHDKSRLFVVFKDNDWIWMREVFKTDDHQLRIYSRNDLIDFKGESIVFKIAGNEEMTLTRK